MESREDQGSPNRWEPVPVPVWVRTKPAQIQNSNLNSKNEKFPKKNLKILQGVTNLMVSIFFKNLFV